MSEKIFLSLGSNIGDREENINLALSFLESSGFVHIKKISSFYETSPVGPKQDNFYNIAVKAYTELGAEDLLLLIKQCEKILGRRKTQKWGPRIIDIDILLYGNRKITLKNLQIPHKELKNRLFALMPLNEIDPFLRHPVLNRKINKILQNILLTHPEQKVKIIQ